LHQKRVGDSIHGRALWSSDLVPGSCQKWPPVSLFAALRSNQDPIARDFAKGSKDRAKAKGLMMRRAFPGLSGNHGGCGAAGGFAFRARME
jgi:hypothetical protein